jgi:hypothetical protein
MEICQHNRETKIENRFKNKVKYAKNVKWKTNSNKNSPYKISDY